MKILPPELRTAIERMRIMGSDMRKYEVKAAWQQLPDNIEETISAFANRDGGTIILGLDEANKFAPVPEFDAKRIHDALLRLGNDFTPPCRLHIERYPFDGSEIVAVIVESSPLNQRPCYITKKGLRFGSFARMKDGNVKLTDYEIERLQEFHQQPTFDRQPVDEASLSDLDNDVLDAIVQRNREISPRIFGKMERNDILVKLGAIVSDSQNAGHYVPTLAGLLAAGIYPQQFFPRLNITFTVYPGVTKAQTVGQPYRYLETQPINGSIPEMLMTSLELLKKHMGRGAIIQGALRRDVTDYPILACREAIINALQHRDYSPCGCGSQVQINLYADRLEILNPGGLFGASSFSSLPPGISATRNARLSQLLAYTPYQEEGKAPGYFIENRGSGLRQIQEELRAALMPEAVLKDFISAFQIQFFKRDFSESKRNNKQWTNFEAALLSELRRKGTLSVPEIIECSGLSRNTVYTRLRSLRERGLIEGIERSNSPRQRYRLVQSPNASSHD